ncbi:MAG: hypothetical protein KAX38_02195, partial [Candidatus Krumholzibacteria bacterium]|nr:hypothetical protein [Candidatus Krumholzibacteria bacterium]
RSGITNEVFQAASTSSGGALYLKDEAGHNTFVQQPDVSTGGGGYFYIMRNETSTGFKVDGNYAATENPHVSITGSANSAYFRMDQTGKESVVLPSSAIASFEIYDEPGAASINAYDGLGLTLTGGMDVLAARTITAPTSGYVLVISSCQIRFSHSSGTASSANFGVSDDGTSFATAQDLELQMPSAGATGTYEFPVTSHSLFSVTSGAHTFYMLGQENSGSFFAFDVQLTAVFIPTAYGTVSPGLASCHDLSEGGTEPALTASDLAAERAESIALNNARIEQELEAMRAELEALKQEVQNR